MRRNWSLALVSVLIVLTPATLLVWLRSQDERLATLEPEPIPLVMTAQAHETFDEQAVAIETSWGVPATVAAPAWSGTVTRVDVSEGESIASGDVIAKVDGIDRVAVATMEPFWRSLARGDKGDDVTMLQRWLSTMGLLGADDVDGLFGFATVDAVKTLATSIGVQKPDGSFDPAWVLWLPQDPFRVDSVRVGPNDPAPAQGSEVLVGPTPLLSITLHDQNGEAVSLQGEWRLLVETTEVPVIDSALGSDALDALASTLDPTQEGASGRLRRAQPATVIEVPSTAVVSGPSGALCVFVADGDTFESTQVDLSGGRASYADVAFGLQGGEEILVNPSDVLQDVDCS